MNSISLKEEIYEKIKKHRFGVSFVELSGLKNFKGHQAIYSEGWDNVLFWPSCSAEACQAIGELLQEKKIKIKPTSVLVYAADGLMINLPVFKSKMKSPSNPKKAHWLPVVFDWVPS